MCRELCAFSFVLFLTIQKENLYNLYSHVAFNIFNFITELITDSLIILNERYCSAEMHFRITFQPNRRVRPILIGIHGVVYRLERFRNRIIIHTRSLYRRGVNCRLGFEGNNEKNARVNITMYSTNNDYTRYKNKKYGKGMLMGNRNAYEDRYAYENQKYSWKKRNARCSLFYNQLWRRYEPVLYPFVRKF